MGENTRITWADDTINFWMGCHPTTNVGCTACYAVKRIQSSRGIDPSLVRRTAEDTWNQAVRWQSRLAETGEIRTVFTCSMSDFFHPHADEWRPEAWQVIKATPNLQWIILTQRIEGVPSRLPVDWGTGYPNVWLGVSASDQAHADKRIPKLLKIPAALHLVSLEPLVAPVVLDDQWLPQTRVTNLKDGAYDVCIDRSTQWGNPFKIGQDGTREEVIAKYQTWLQGQPELMGQLDTLKGKRLGCHCHPESCHGDVLVNQVDGNRLKWVITGGMSGDNWQQYRLYPSWVRGLRDACHRAGVAFFFKQLGGAANNYRDGDQAVLDGRTWKEVPRSTCQPVMKPKQVSLF